MENRRARVRDRSHRAILCCDDSAHLTVGPICVCEMPNINILCQGGIVLLPGCSSDYVKLLW